MRTTAVVRGTRRGRRTRLAIAASSVLALTIGATVVAAYAQDDPPTARYSFFTGADTSRAVLDPDTQSVELGLKWRSSTGGTVEAVRFLKAPGDPGPHQVSLWTGNGKRLASAVSRAETAQGWQEVKLPAPVQVTAGRTYVVSYHTTRYVATNNALAARPLTAGPLTAPAKDNGVYAYGTTALFPNQTYRSTNYWVDVVFAAPITGAPGSSSSASPPTGTPASPSVPASPTDSPAPPPGPPPPPPPGGLALPRVPWEGGPAYYGGFAATAAWKDPNFFPVGVWFESVLSTADVAKDKAAGLNTYVVLTANSDPALVRAAGGMYIVAGGLKGEGAESVGHALSDEADMNYGPGSDGWSGKEGWNTCVPIQDKGGKCGYTFMQSVNDHTPNDGRPRYANYGKGVAMWESEAEAQVFVNKYQQLVSDDMYFYTDPNLCPGEAGRFLGIPPESCRRAANYGAVLDRMRKLDGADGKRVPVYGFVEDGHPFTEASAPTITGDQIAGAVMNSLIHEARGIIYFNHNFGGPCQSQHVLRDACGTAVRPKVTETNQRIAALAPVLNTQSYQWVFNPAMDTMLKAANGSYYVFAMPGRAGGTGSQTLTLPAGITGGSAQVMFENRAVPVTGGKITDSFPNEFTYHIYKITP